MRKVVLIGLLLAVCFLAVWFIPGLRYKYLYAYSSVCRIDRLTGDVSVCDSDERRWVRLAKGRGKISDLELLTE